MSDTPRTDAAIKDARRTDGNYSPTTLRNHMATIECELAVATAERDKYKKFLESTIRYNCDFEDELVELLGVRPRKDEYDDTDDGRIIERCKELMGERDELLRDRELLLRVPVHTHVAGRDGNLDKCHKCGHDIREIVHLRVIAATGAEGK